MRPVKFELFFGSKFQREDTGWLDVFTLAILCLHFVIGSSHIAILVLHKKDYLFRTGSVGTLCRSAIGGIITAFFLWISNRPYSGISDYESSVIKGMFGITFSFYLINHFIREFEFAWVYTDYSEIWLRNSKIVFWIGCTCVCASIAYIIPIDTLDKDFYLCCFVFTSCLLLSVFSSIVHSWTDSTLRLGHIKHLNFTKMLVCFSIVYSLSLLFGFTSGIFARNYLVWIFVFLANYEYYKYISSYLKQEIRYFDQSGLQFKSLKTSKEEVLFHVQNSLNQRDFIKENEDVMEDFLDYCQNMGIVKILIGFENKKIKPADWICCYRKCVSYLKATELGKEEESKALYNEILVSYIKESATTIQPLKGMEEIQKIKDFILKSMIKTFGSDYFASGFFCGEVWRECFIRGANLRKIESIPQRQIEKRKVVLFRMLHNDSEALNYFRKNGWLC